MGRGDNPTHTQQKLLPPFFEKDRYRYKWSFCVISKNNHILPKKHALGIQSPYQRILGVSNHLLRKVFRFHYYSQKVIGSLRMVKLEAYITQYISKIQSWLLLDFQGRTSSWIPYLEDHPMTCKWLIGPWLINPLRIRLFPLETAF